jgi:hypothetical protein
MSGLKTVSMAAAAVFAFASAAHAGENAGALGNVALLSATQDNDTQTETTTAAVGSQANKDSVVDSFNSTRIFDFSTNFIGGVHARPVATAVLLGGVIGNSVTLRNDASRDFIRAGNDKLELDASVNLSNGALAGFTGVNNMPINTGMNSEIQAPISIAVSVVNGF